MSLRRAALLLGFSLCLAESGCRGPGVLPSAAVPPVRPPPSLKRQNLAPAATPPVGFAASRAPVTLANGASLIVETDRLASTVAVAAFFAVSAADEPQPGARHFLERLLLDVESAAGARAAWLRERGSEVVSFTTPDYTAYQVVTARGKWSPSLDLVRQLFDEPPASEAALARQRRDIFGELSAMHGDGEALRRLFAAAYTGHPYEKPLLGTAETLAALPAPPLRALHRRGYRPDRLTVVVVGDVDAKAVVEQLQDRFADLPPAPAGPAAAPAEPPPSTGPRVTLLPGAAQEVWLGFATPPAATLAPPAPLTALAALDVATVLLSGDSSKSFMVSGRQPGLLVMATPARSLDDATRSSLAAALRLGQREVAPSELMRATSQLLLHSAARSETPAGRAQRLGAFSLLGIDEAAYEASLSALNPTTLRDTLAHLLVANHLTLGVVAPKNGVDEGRLRAVIDETVSATSGEERAAQASVASGRALLYRTRSGARIVILPGAQKKSVALAALWPGGQRLEDERSAGLHELLLRVWPDRSAPSTMTLEPQVEADSFGVRAQFLGQELPQALALLRDCLEHPSITDVDIERGRRELFERIGVRDHGAKLEESAASRVAWRLFLHNLLGSHPYALRPNEQSLTGLTRRRLLDFFRQHYGREGMVLAVVGDVDPATLLGELSPWLGSATPLAGERPPAPLYSEKPVPRPPGGQAFQAVSAQQAHLVLGFAAPGAYSGDRAAVEVLFELLAGPGGRLERALLSRRGLAYSIEGFLSPGLSPGYLAFSLSSAPQKLEAAEATLRDELHRLVDHPAELDEVVAARERLASRRALKTQRRIDRAWTVAQALALGLPDRALGEPLGPFGSLGLAEARLGAVDAQAVQAAARTLLREEQMVRAAAIPATRLPLFGILPEAPRLTPTEYRRNAKNVVSRSAKSGDDRRDGARSQHLPDGRRGRPLSGRLQGVAGHAAKVRREARR